MLILYLCIRFQVLSFSYCYWTER